MILPVAEAITATCPKNATPGQEQVYGLNTIVRSAGDGGVSTISSAARQERELAPIEAFTDS
jgi:hypothetical protein